MYSYIEFRRGIGPPPTPKGSGGVLTLSPSPVNYRKLQLYVREASAILYRFLKNFKLLKFEFRLGT